jgi:UDP-N-acetylmuramoyl-L-alanyl-D-glutamate--2,6-diaminopimelate ligase
MKTLHELFPDTTFVRGNMLTAANELTLDSRKVTPGTVFFAVKGTLKDGHDFIPEAISRGAVAIVSEEPFSQNLRELASDGKTTFIQVPSLRHAMAEAAQRFWEMPQNKPSLFGITGTKGKTTTTYLVRHLLKAAGKETGLLSTIENDLVGRKIPASRTTATALDIAAYMAEMVKNGCTNAAMEVSSHALDQGRVLGLRFDAAVFNNLQPEHLDYHGDMENYYLAKRKLFDGTTIARPKISVINLDDSYGQRLQTEIREKNKIITFGTCSACDLLAENIRMLRDRTLFTLSFGNESLEVNLPLLGHHNVMNALAALGCAYACGIIIKDSTAALENFTGVPGRLERVDCGQDFDLIIDYAHTEESLRQAISALRKVYSNGRIITVFGCGGSRDAFKRPKMTTAAMELSDFTIATADNPRRESIQEIFAMMETGIIKEIADKIEFIESRREAISHAIYLARAGDCVLIAGKGHETYQEFADAIVSFDDREVAREILKEHEAKV